MIKEIYIKKFRQLEDVKEDKLGKINELYGSNGCGKTSFISFITWIIYGETLDYGKTDDKNIDEFKPFELISGEITLDNDYSFSRVYGYEDEENPDKKTNDFFVNGRKCKNQKEYYDSINEAFNVKLDKNLKIKDLNIVRALSDPYLLPNNETQFRTLIDSLLNVDTYSFLFNDSDKYTKIKNDFDKQDKDYDKCRTFYKQQLKDIENKLDTTNLKISELKSVKFDKEEYDKLVNEINDFKSGFKVEELNGEYENKVKEMNIAYDKLIESRKQDLIDKPLSKEEIEYKEIKEKRDVLFAEYNQKKLTNDNNIQLRKLVNDKINELNRQLSELKESKFIEIKCPNCDTLVNEKDYKEFNKNKVDKTKSIKNKIEIANKELENYKDFDLEVIIDKGNGYKEQLIALQTIINSNVNIYSSDLTNALNEQYNDLHNEVVKLRENNSVKRNEYLTNYNNTIKCLEEKISEMNVVYNKVKELEIHKINKKTLLENKSTYELRLNLLEKYKLDEIKILKDNTSKIFGNDFEFELLVKNASNDNYKKVCYASVDGLNNDKSNTAKYLKISTIMLEKIKSFIGGCDLPIIFDIADNIGKKTRNEIFKMVESQIFYTRIDDEENVERKLRVINE